MANRSIHELLALAVADYRFYLGTIADYSGNGNDLIWQAGQEPVFRREVGGAIGLDFSVNHLLATPAITYQDEFTYEVMMYARGMGEANTGRIIDPTTGSCELRWNVANIRFNCGVAFNSPLTPPCVTHVVAARDGSDDGHTYFDGVPQVVSAVGGDDVVASQVRIGNWAGGTRTFNGVLYAIRIFNDHLDPDEAARLYEHSRIQLWPGAHKRSGIVSPI